MPAAMRPLPKETQDLLAKKGMSADSPIFVRIFKEESELEVWKKRDDGRFHHFKSYPICNWSGGLGPKVKQGDKQAPEGFYTISPGQMNPNSQFHLAFNMGFPNAYDRVHGRTGAHLMVHGDCRSAGCYAMTDALVEEIYAIAREAFKGGQETFEVHAYPFRMTPENMKRHAKSEWMGFWRTLKEGYDAFEVTHQPPPVAVCEKRYVVNARFEGGRGPSQPDGACPPHQKLKPDLMASAPDAKAPEERVTAIGKKTRNLVAEAAAGANIYGPVTASVTPTAHQSRGLLSWGLGGPATASRASRTGTGLGFSQ